MKLKDFKFEDIAYYIDNIQPFLKNKLNQLNEPVIDVQNSKRLIFISINSVFFIFYTYLFFSMNYSLNCSMIVNLIVTVIFLFFVIISNSRILYAFNNRQKLIKNFEIEENYNVKFIFSSALVNKIKYIRSELNLNGKTDLAILFLYVQYFVLRQKISNSEIIRQINISFEFEHFSEAHYSKVANDLFEWKDKNAKKKDVKETSKYSSHLEKFKDIEDNFKDFIY